MQQLFERQPPGPDDGPGPEAGEEASTPDAACTVDASLTAFAASDASAAGCAACVNSMCSAAITTCSSECLCINLFSCLADAGVAATGLGTGSFVALSQCIPGGLAGATGLLTDPGLAGIYTCLTMTCGDECAPATEGGTPEAGTPPEAGPDGGADAGATASDAGDSGAP